MSSSGLVQADSQLPALLAGAAFVASLGLTGWFRRTAHTHLRLDIPNARSLHTVATPRGGGVAIAVSVVFTFLARGTAGWLNWWVLGAICGGGALVAVIGFADDQRHVPPLWRLAGHFSAAALVIAGLSGRALISGFGFAPEWRWVLAVAAVLYIVWMINLTNFMDGIDGIASVEAITVCLGAALVAGLTAPNTRLWPLPLILASATLGFLVWNWPPAKIFMGDAGSGFLGFMLAALSLVAGTVAGRLFWVWVILLGVFVVDATITLVRRVARGEKFYEAHRTHAYQHAALRRGAHKPVTLAVGAINLCWLMPIALLVALGRVSGLVGLAIAYTPLAVAAVRMNAGKPAAAT